MFHIVLDSLQFVQNCLDISILNPPCHVQILQAPLLSTQRVSVGKLQRKVLHVLDHAVGHMFHIVFKSIAKVQNCLDIENSNPS